VCDDLPTERAKFGHWTFGPTLAETARMTCLCWSRVPTSWRWPADSLHGDKYRGLFVQFLQHQLLHSFHGHPSIPNSNGLQYISAKVNNSHKTQYVVNNQPSGISLSHTIQDVVYISPGGTSLSHTINNWSKDKPLIL